MALFDFELIWYISAVEVASLAIALVLVVLAYRVYRKSRSRSFLLAAPKAFSSTSPRASAGRTYASRRFSVNDRGNKSMPIPYAYQR